MLTSLLDFFSRVIDTYDTDNNKAVALEFSLSELEKSIWQGTNEKLMEKVNARGIQGDAARWISRRAPTVMHQPILELNYYCNALLSKQLEK